jgi:transcriptional regulator GlxA family with amidase domain
MTAKTDSLEIGVLLYPGHRVRRCMALTDLFTVANRVAAELGEHQLPLLRVSHWQLDAAGQLQVIHDSLPQAGHAPRAMLIPPAWLPRLRRAAGRSSPRTLRLAWPGTVLASVCIGVFLIAGSGLLDGRSACTHWNYAQALSERFPKVRVATSQPLLDDGDIVTSAGLMAWTDLGLHLIERFLGHTLARETALPGGGAGTGACAGGAVHPRLEHGDEAVLRVQHWLQGEQARVAGLADMARCAGLEPRTFCGAFAPPPACAHRVCPASAGWPRLPAAGVHPAQRRPDRLGRRLSGPRRLSQGVPAPHWHDPSDYRRRFAVGGE